MLGIGQCGDGQYITNIWLDTKLLPEWLHPWIYRSHLSRNDNGQKTGMEKLFGNSRGQRHEIQANICG